MKLLRWIWKCLRQMRGPDVEAGQVWEHCFHRNAFVPDIITRFEVRDVRGEDATGLESSSEDGFFGKEERVHSHEWLRMCYFLSK